MRAPEEPSPCTSRAFFWEAGSPHEIRGRVTTVTLSDYESKR
jgi:hypothetical protein